jgi:hypothetical protein
MTLASSNINFWPIFTSFDSQTHVNFYVIIIQLNVQQNKVFVTNIKHTKASTSHAHNSYNLQY